VRPACGGVASDGPGTSDTGGEALVVDSHFGSPADLRDKNMDDVMDAETREPPA
jgi:hypothetical protein